MSGTNNGPDGSGRRWWEIGGGREQDEGRYGDLVTGGRGRSRPERSLSAGADPTDEPRPPLRGFLWPVVSVVAAGALILLGVYGLSSKGSSESPETTRSPVAAAPGSGQDDVGREPLVPPAPLGDQPGGDALPPLGGAEGIPGGAGGDSGDNPGNQGDQPNGRPTSTLGAPPPIPPVKVDGPAPVAPGAQQGGPPVPGRSGCSGIGTGEYACTVTQPAPVYLAGTTKPRGPLPANRYRFLCQSDGSRYSVGNRTNHWWAWVGNSKVGAWVPVVFLAGGPNNGAVPGLPVCNSDTTVRSTTTPIP